MTPALVFHSIVR